MKPSAQLKNAAVVTAVQNMFDQGHFSISDLREATELAGVRIPTDISQVLRPFHCVDWGAMGEETRKEIMKLCLSLFTDIDTEEYNLRNFSRVNTVELVNSDPSPGKKSLFKLIGV